MRNKGSKQVTHQTINGSVAITRKVYWSSQTGMVAPADHWLGIDKNRYSPGLREMVCRLSLNEAFVPASKNLKRLVQVTLSSSAIRGIVSAQANWRRQTERSEHYKGMLVATETINTMS